MSEPNIDWIDQDAFYRLRRDAAESISADGGDVEILLRYYDAQAARIAALEAVLPVVRDVLDGYPAHTPRCPCSLCLLHAAVEGLT